MIDPYQATVLRRPLAIRVDPSFDSIVLQVIPKGGIVQVIDGPVIAEGASWVRVVAECTPCEAWCLMLDTDKEAMIA